VRTTEHRILCYYPFCECSGSNSSNPENVAVDVLQRGFDISRPERAKHGQDLLVQVPKASGWAAMLGQRRRPGIDGFSTASKLVSQRPLLSRHERTDDARGLPAACDPTWRVPTHLPDTYMSAPGDLRPPRSPVHLEIPTEDHLFLRGSI
jgi:hypothetical protein